MVNWNWPGTLVGYRLKEGVVYDGISNPQAIFLGGVQDNATARHGAFQSARELLEQDVAPATRTASKRIYFPYYTSSSTTGPYGEWPPLVAIRDRQFKLHLWTKGSSRHPTGRADWQYPTASVCAAGVQNWTAQPLLFDLYKDPGENVPRTPLEGWDGTWPAPSGWHSGSMPADVYNQTVTRLLAAFEAERAGMPHVESVIQRGHSPDRFPCCSPACSPKPHCCTCDADGPTPQLQPPASRSAGPT